MAKPQEETADAEKPSVVLNTYYDNGKVLVLDDVFGAELERNGFASLPTNPIVTPNGNPLTARAATNLAIVDTPDKRIIGIYRGYGTSIGDILKEKPFEKGKIQRFKKKTPEGVSRPFPLWFEPDDVTPITPIPTKPIIDTNNRLLRREAMGGIEDGRLASYCLGYFNPFVRARMPNSRGTKYSLGGAILDHNLTPIEIFSLKGLPHFMKDPVPENYDGHIHVMSVRPSPPSSVESRPSYRGYYSKHPGIWIATSHNLKTWDVMGEVLRPLEDEDKIGDGTPSVDETETLGGKLKYIHGVTGENTPRRNYSGRAVLFQSDDPTTPISMTDNFLCPTEPHEMNDELAIDHVFPMGTIKRKVEIRGRVYDAHIVSAGTGDTSSSLYIVLINYLANNLKPINSFKFAGN